MAQTGKTTGNLKLRSGPGLEFEPPLAFLTPDTALEVLGEQGDWLHVRVGGQEGYVGKKYVQVSGSAAATDGKSAAEGGIKKHVGPLPNQGAGQPGKAHKGVDKE